METDIDANIKTHFATLEDPRSEINRKHKLLDIIVIAIIAVICGANDWEAAEVTVECRYYLSSCTHLKAHQLLDSVRTYWSIENSLH